MSPLPTAKESTVQPSNSFVMSKFNVKQTKAQVFESSNSTTSTMASSNYSMIKPTQMNKDQLMLDEYMSRLNQMEMDKKSVPNNNNNIKKSMTPILPRKSESTDNVLTSEFMRVREEKFGRLTNDDKNEMVVARENQKNLARSAMEHHINCKFQIKVYIHKLILSIDIKDLGLKKS